MNGGLQQLVLLILAGIGVVGLFVLLIKKWKLVLKLAVAAIVLAGAAVVLCKPLDFPFCRHGTPPGGGGGGAPGAGPGPQGPLVVVQQTPSGLQVTNRSGATLFIRAAFVVSTGGGYVGSCNPYDASRPQTVPIPEAPTSPYDQALPPFQTLTVPSRLCPNYVGYSVWARNLDRVIVFEQHR